MLNMYFKKHVISVKNMKTIVALIYLTFFCSYIATAKSLDSTAVDAINKKMEAYLVKADIPSLLSLYTTDCNYLPEFGPTITTKDQLAAFYRSWFAKSTVISYNKSIYEVQSIGNYLLEIGTMTISYRKGNEANKEYHAKYMVIWRRDQASHLH